MQLKLNYPKGAYILLNLLMSEEKNIIKEADPVEPTKKNRKRRLSILFLLNGEFLQREYFLKNLPFFLFIAFMLAIYIANAYYAENKIREISSTETDIKELHAEFISLKAELTEKCKEYQVSQKLKGTGMEISVIPPRVIEVDAEQYQGIY